MKIKLVRAGSQFQEQILDEPDYFRYPRIRPVYLVNDDDGFQSSLQSMAQHKLGLGHRPFDRIYQKKAAVCHVYDTLHLTAEISMPRGINDIDFDAPVHYGRILSHDGNPLFSLKGISVHD